MQIIIPMSGFGERFLRGGYSLPKSLIEIRGKPIISHVIDMFPMEEDFIFICNKEHLDHPDYRMKDVLQHYCPTGRILGIDPHKLGPVYAVMQAEMAIDFTKQTIVNYCDFSCYWDWEYFKLWVADNRCVGAIPAYKGFHPHALGNTNYAYMREHNGWLQDIQEKQPYTDNRMEEYASSGTYYFASGEIMRSAFRKTISENIHTNGEFYVSMAYKSLLRDKQAVAVYPLQHFMQWGTPEDVVEFNAWSTAFDRLSSLDEVVIEPRGTVVVPMAGLGQRFSNSGYTTAKPLITVSGKPMVMQAVGDLPAAKQYAFVLRYDMRGYEAVVQTIKQTYPNAVIASIPSVTQGQACTALIGLDLLEQHVGEVPSPITFGTCDAGVLYSSDVFNKLLDDQDVDVIVWVVRGHANAVRHPQMFGWVDAMPGGVIKRISVKVPLESPASDPIAIGIFTFKHASEFRKMVDHLIDKDERINGEFYIDSCINIAIEMGLNCKLFEVDSFLSWGTPDDLKTFEYWQSCFHKWLGHPYRLEGDRRVLEDAVAGLEDRYRATMPRKLIV